MLDTIRRKSSQKVANCSAFSILNIILVLSSLRLVFSSHFVDGEMFGNRVSFQPLSPGRTYRGEETFRLRKVNNEQVCDEKTLPKFEYQKANNFGSKIVGCRASRRVDRTHSNVESDRTKACTSFDSFGEQTFGDDSDV